MTKKRKEKRISGRFYEDNPYDIVLLVKVREMMKDKEFRNVTELIRRGINLAYEECYHVMENSNIDSMKMEVKYTADEIAKSILLQLDQRMEVHDAKILGAISVGGTTLGMARSEVSLVKNDAEVMTENEMGNLTEETLSFLSNLNKD